LYKVYKSGDIIELKDDDMPLVHRVWMGPFLNEDKIFIMEKGRKDLLIADRELNDLIQLPDELLYNLLENLSVEQENEQDYLQKEYNELKSLLDERLNKLQKEL
jgi:hypothetical protein